MNHRDMDKGGWWSGGSFFCIRFGNYAKFPLGAFFRGSATRLVFSKNVCIDTGQIGGFEGANSAKMKGLLAANVFFRKKSQAIAIKVKGGLTASPYATEPHASSSIAPHNLAICKALAALDSYFSTGRLECGSITIAQCVPFLSMNHPVVTEEIVLTGHALLAYGYMEDHVLRIPSQRHGRTPL